MPIIYPLNSQSEDTIETLLDIAFGENRHSRTAYKIRQGTDWLEQFSYAALDNDGNLLGLLQSWPVALVDGDGATTALIMVGPVAVMPDHQGAGIGRMLMDKLVADADKYADAPLMMIGDPEYYGRFWGFTADATQSWSLPGPVEMRRLLSRNVPGAPALRNDSAAMLTPRPITNQAQ